MKKTLFLLFLIFSSCHYPRYTHMGDVNGILDFSKGKWLLYTVQSTSDVKKNLTNLADDKFTELLGKRFSTLGKTNGILIPSKISDNPSKMVLIDIKNGSKYDFFVNIIAEKIAEEMLGNIQLGGIDTPVKNSGEITLDVYDLNLLEENLFSDC